MSNTNTMSTTSPVTFHVFRKDGSRNPDVKRSFIEKHNITAHDAMEGFLRLEDQTLWSLVLEAEVKEAFKSTMSVYCIVSYQARANGNFAVARLYKENYKSKRRES